MKTRCHILGAGLSGIGTAKLAAKKGFDVYVSDSGYLKKDTKFKFDEWGVSWEENSYESNFSMDTKWIMKSPGISNNSPSIVKAKKLGIPIISEIEFASRYTDAKIIGITGSNGKTTTTELTYHILKKSGYNVGIAGNVGKSFAQQVAENSFDIYVLELSSFQLDDIVHFSPDISVITNISSDHLDRYNNDFNKYIASKLRISLNQSKDQFIILNANDQVLMNSIKNVSIRAQKHFFGFDLEGKHITTVKKNRINIINNKSNIMISTNTFKLKGRHNLLNAMAASTVASILKLNNDNIRDSLLNFKGLPHRLEYVLKIQDVNYVNDSKATNVNATFYALETLTTRGIWIACC